MNNRRLTMVAAALFVAALAALALVANGQERTSAGGHCSPEADSFKIRADAYMAEYLTAHQTGRGNKDALRQAIDELPEPACANGAKAAVMEWLDAVDSDNQQAMNEADERYLTALR